MLPKDYHWLETVGTLPLMVQHALALLGTKEKPGAGNNAEILSWRKELQEAGFTGVDGYSADSIPWCGLFMAIVAKRAGKSFPGQPLWALNWQSFGNPANQPQLGDVLVFIRSGGGHVGIYVGEDASCYHVLGGNQSDAVTITRIQKKRLFRVRRPAVRTAMPASARPYILAATGAVSTNEA